MQQHVLTLFFVVGMEQLNFRLAQRMERLFGAPCLRRTGSVAGYLVRFNTVTEHFTHYVRGVS
jgi:hypothetical protein